MANCTGRVPDAGRAKLAQLLKDTDGLPAIYVAWGGEKTAMVGSTWPDISNSDTGLLHEVERKRGTVTRTDADTYSVTASFDGIVEAGGAVSSKFTDMTLWEIGLFDAATGGTMLYRGGYSTDSPSGSYNLEGLDLTSVDVLNITIQPNIKSTNVSVTTTGKTKALDLLCQVPV